MTLNDPIKQMEVRKLSQRIHGLKKNLTRYQVADTSRRIPPNSSTAQPSAMPDPQQALSQLPGFHVTANILQRHYTKGLTVKSPYNN